MGMEVKDIVEGDPLSIQRCSNPTVTVRLMIALKDIGNGATDFRILVVSPQA